jgi:hypothetical protein
MGGQIAINPTHFTHAYTASSSSHGGQLDPLTTNREDEMIERDTLTFSKPPETAQKPAG